MGVDFHSLLTFHVTGRGMETIEGKSLIPAALAPYRDLAALRYDFPLVLCTDGVPRSLSSIIDGLGLEPGAERSHALKIEAALRKAVCRGARGPLMELWDKAAGRAKARAHSGFAESANSLRKLLRHDGEVVDCDKSFPTRFLGHAFKAAQTRKLKALRTDINRLILKLENILRADEFNSLKGRAPEALKAGVGAAHIGSFDFDRMSELLSGSLIESSLPPSRRRRIERLLETLKKQRFVPLHESPKCNGSMPYSFLFDSCEDAIEASRQRLPAAIELSKALTMGALEAAGEYVEARHDSIFEAFGERGMDRAEWARFPSYLVCLNAAKLTPTEIDRVLDSLATGLPFKFLVQTDGLFDAPGAHGARPATARKSLELCQAAVGFGNVFVAQAPASRLYPMRESIAAGMAFDGPAIFSVYSGVGTAKAPLSPFLAAAAAVESRVFPALVFDPRGSEWADKFSVESTPSPETSRPRYRVFFEDSMLQKQEEETEFSAVDFLACEPRFAVHFAMVEEESWKEHGTPAFDYSPPEGTSLPSKLPFLAMVDSKNLLHRVLVSEAMMAEARRIESRWRSLQELGGVRNSFAERLLARREKEWAAKLEEMEERLREAPAPAPSTNQTSPTSLTSPTSPTDAALAEAPPSDEPWIETARCTTCNECTGINAQMFAYNENKQAYIKDPLAGTFAQLVEAAESCQVSIIHPGKPKNPSEPGLDDLLKRAAPFL